MTKLEKMAKDHATFDFNRVGVFQKMTSTTHAESFIEGFRAAIEMLRSDFAPINIEPFYPYNESWAKWLESECAKEVE